MCSPQNGVKLPEGVWCQTTPENPRLCPPVLIHYSPLLTSPSVLCLTQHAMVCDSFAFSPCLSYSQPCTNVMLQNSRLHF